MRRAVPRVATALAALVLLTAAAAGGASRSSPGGIVVDTLTRAEALRMPAGSLPRAFRPARASSTWCGTPSQQDRIPNATAGYPAHWIYAIPSDGTDGFAAEASAMQTDAELIDSWWRGQDPTRTLRSDLAQFPCGQQLDLSSLRLGGSGAQLDTDARFGDIVDSLIALGFHSSFDKYVVYYDGPISDQNLCGQGGADRTGFGVAVVFVRSCGGVAPSLVAAHELLHTLGAVPAGAPHECPPPNEGHVCDTTSDLMYPFVSDVPLSSEILDAGRDDYYGHSGSWPDVQDSPWLVQLDRQAPFALTVSGPGSVTADVPGLLCSASCTTTWNSGTRLALEATPSPGAKLVRWAGACAGAGACGLTVGPGVQASALFAPARYRLSVSLSGKGTVRSSRAGISCRPRCSAAFPSYVPLRLTAKAAKGWRFRSWSGGCRGSRPVCTLPMRASTSARAVFAKA